MSPICVNAECCRKGKEMIFVTWTCFQRSWGRQSPSRISGWLPWVPGCHGNRWRLTRLSILQTRWCFQSGASNNHLCFFVLCINYLAVGFLLNSLISAVSLSICLYVALCGPLENAALSRKLAPVSVFCEVVTKVAEPLYCNSDLILLKWPWGGGKAASGWQNRAQNGGNNSISHSFVWLLHWNVALLLTCEEWGQY